MSKPKRILWLYGSTLLDGSHAERVALLHSEQAKDPKPTSTFRPSPATGAVQ